MKDKLINDVIQAMMPHLNCNQIKLLNDVLVASLCGKEIKNNVDDKIDDNKLVNLFISAKRVEGLSERCRIFYDIRGKR